ncbi:MAG: Ig-like domain-containing protein, partial [Candidatus Marinimicrobia bacterium]|nr:Ig-like domain-containing protein [Candidatus Neomarinimicrobiota bacterium]
QNVDLYKKDATLIGVIYAEQDDENTNLADGVTVIADFNNYDISPDEFTTTTDTGGVFSFSNLPATPNVNIRTMPFNDGTNDYAVTSRSLSLIPGGTANVGNLILTIASSTPFIVQNNFENNDFGLTENIVVTFSKAMDASTFDISLFSFSYGNVEFESSWSNSITLTIDPYVLLQANTNYTLSLSGKSLDNNNFSDTYSFATQEGIQFVKTNLENVDGVFKEFPVDSNIELTFSMAVDLSNYNGYVRLYDESNALVSTEQSLSTDSLTVIIDPLYDLEAGQGYTMNYVVHSYIEGDYDSDSFPFQSATDITIPAQVTGFAIDMGDSWKADWNTTSITFKWSRVTGVDGYRIYAKDNHNNSDFVRVGSFSAQDYVTEQSGTVSLPSQFDYYADDGIQTPFSNSTEITFKIAAYNDAGEGTFSSALIVKDETGPTGNLFGQSGSANNSFGTSEIEFTITFSASEYLDGNATPSVSFIETGGDPNYKLPSSAVSFEWDNDLMRGVFTITVPAGKDGSGDIFTASAFKDNSGNTGESLDMTLY